MVRPDARICQDTLESRIRRPIGAKPVEKRPVLPHVFCVAHQNWGPPMSRESRFLLLRRREIPVADTGFVIVSDGVVPDGRIPPVIESNLQQSSVGILYD